VIVSLLALPSNFEIISRTASVQQAELAAMPADGGLGTSKKISVWETAANPRNDRPNVSLWGLVLIKAPVMTEDDVLATELPYVSEAFEPSRAKKRGTNCSTMHA
jgi:hypothetical protein